MAPGAIDEASRVRGNRVSRLDTNSLSCQDPAVAREETQYYFKCSSCRWFGPLTKDELVTIRVNELGSSPCPRCGQAGYLDPAMSSRRGSLTTWITVAAVIALVSLVAALS
jgi:hypothetical protein